MAMRPAAGLARIRGMKKGETVRNPRLSPTSQGSWKVCMPPTPLDTMTPQRVRSSCSRFRPLSARHSLAAVMASWM